MAVMEVHYGYAVNCRTPASCNRYPIHNGQSQYEVRPDILNLSRAAKHFAVSTARSFTETLPGSELIRKGRGEDLFYGDVLRFSNLPGLVDGDLDVKLSGYSVPNGWQATGVYWPTVEGVLCGEDAAAAAARI